MRLSRSSQIQIRTLEGNVLEDSNNNEIEFLEIDMNCSFVGVQKIQLIRTKPTYVLTLIGMLSF